MLSLLAFTGVATASYAGHQVLSCDSFATPQKTLQALDDSLGLDVWGIRNNRTEIRVTPQQKSKVVATFGGKCNVIVEDVQHFVDENAKTEGGLVSKACGSHTEYCLYEDLIQWYVNLEAASDLVALVDIGLSAEDRRMIAIQLTGAEGNKVHFYWQCLIHAREWISGATCMYLVDNLVQLYGAGDPSVTALLDRAVIHVVPVVNPDGYAHTQVERLWRKSRNTNSGSSCQGTDLNRNYDDHWGEGGSSNNPCSDTYMGQGAGSEIEVQNTMNYLKNIDGDVLGAVDWHSYTQLLLRPYGWSSADSPDEVELAALGNRMREAILSVHGRAYTSIRSNGLYLTTGSASDWFYSPDAQNGRQHRIAGFTFELRPTGANPGFQLPASEIIAQGEEMLPAVLVYSNGLIDSPLPPASTL